MYEDQKSVVTENKSSTEILTELFSSFDVEPPILIKKEKSSSSKKNKKNKKKHKYKEKKHRKKDKKRKRDDSTEGKNIQIKEERHSPSKKIKTEDSSSDEALTPEIKREDAETDIETTTFKAELKSEKDLNDEEDKSKKKTSKIKIKSLEFSSIFAATIREIQEKQNLGNVEDGEIQSSDETLPEVNKKKKKHTHEKHKKKKSSHSEDRSRSCSRKKEKESASSLLKKEYKSDDDLKKNKYRNERVKTDHKCKDGYKSDDYYKPKDYHKSSKDSFTYKDHYRSRSHDQDDHKRSLRHENPFYRDKESYKHKEKSSRDHSEHDDRWYTKDRYKSRDDDYRRHRDISRDGDYIDKQKLLEIARKNAIQMMKSGNLPAALTLGRQAQEKVLAAIRAGGKTIKELTEFCKALSKKEESGELSGGSGIEDRESDGEHKAFHHPFQIKDRPSSIIMNIKNSVPLPTKTALERNTELRLQFPVSSGTLHRKTEGTGVPESPKKIENSPVISSQLPVSAVSLDIEVPPVIEQPAPAVEPAQNAEEPVFPPVVDVDINISQIVSQRLSAMRKLQENPYDVEALTTMHKSQKKMQSWAESKQVPGQFTGSTGANILSQAELASGYQAWAKKDQLQNAAPVSGGMGMQLLKKMGWNPGEGLGKDKSGALQPLLLEVKLDKKGLVANEEQKRKQNQLKQKAQKITSKSLEAKHPVSLLGEFTAKRKIGAPDYTLCLESGPDHKKMFLFQVSVNGLVCKPDVASPNKKQAKADAAKLCLQKLGLLST